MTLGGSHYQPRYINDNEADKSFLNGISEEFSNSEKFKYSNLKDTKFYDEKLMKNLKEGKIKRFLIKLCEEYQGKANGLWGGKTVELDGKTYKKMPTHLAAIIEDAKSVDRSFQYILSKLKESKEKKIGFWSGVCGGRNKKTKGLYNTSDSLFSDMQNKEKIIEANKTRVPGGHY
ncbi:hypothetical protein [Piscirickettsia litoralis]|uniref:Uncharacterized protein n=1 Tax=Piscirickettsia litoralis TaxID=1891921 RepID=A0ABX2ZZ39_9GAMM|nr:hypothetical protein [Piscirickettsia litoralis]ODN41788.1 hypothetical protein BGC07_00825 [Piscirickettsia litoralis]